MPRTREKGNEIDEIISKSNAATARRPVSAIQPDAARAKNPDTSELDSVLDKISQEGIESLTSDERRLLEQRSRELRRRD